MRQGQVLADRTPKRSELSQVKMTDTTMPSTIIIRHRREKSKKCSVRPLRGLPGFVFGMYPRYGDLDLQNYVRLGIGGPMLGPADRSKGLLVLDSSWRHVTAMERMFEHVPVRSLPPLKTAFPRISKLGTDPDGGLATVEAVYAALVILGRDTTGVLDHYHWRDRFLELNASLFSDLTTDSRTAS